ncbi:hypothetical protein LZA78_13650 [Sinirhodobacter sp. WL0062]|uniref:Uncharacterized protein n=1 Tax=Rhodobacter flavimaris TaxID=2907145 RepID=A0ABS8YYG0_9RHOB|nr:hypothetical protein [Sinirhodobacter sp. WL0062]MCE5974528.1 hypothetical protein [Sinirhodobacter sp. WL0062]
MEKGAKFLVLALAMSAAIPAWAVTFREGEAQLRQAYGAYRDALFLSNQGKQAETAAALEKFDVAWSQIVAGWTIDPPPQYAEDMALAETFTTVNGLIATAGQQVGAGDLPTAHLTLEEVREAVAALHMRNDMVGFSDRMNAYHAAMEEVLETDFAALGDAGLARMQAEAAVLEYLAGQILAHPAPEATDPTFAPLLEGFLASVTAFGDAARAGDLAAGIAAQSGLKVPYSKLFAKFG